jgi:hypothetical protein
MSLRIAPASPPLSPPHLHTSGEALKSRRMLAGQASWARAPAARRPRARSARRVNMVGGVACPPNTRHRTLYGTWGVCVCVDWVWSVLVYVYGVLVGRKVVRIHMFGRVARPRRRLTLVTASTVDARGEERSRCRGHPTNSQRLGMGRDGPGGGRHTRGSGAVVGSCGARADSGVEG